MTSQPLPIVHHPHYRIPLRAGHRFPMSKYGYLREALEARGLLAPGRYVAPAPAEASQIALAHAPGYVDRALSQTLEEAEVKAIGLPFTAALARRAQLTAAGTTLAAWLALEHGIALNAAGGSHHAMRGGGAGFCVFNDVAVAAVNLLAQGVAAPFLVFDADVHQGDGTAEIFAGDPRVFTASIHAANNYPAEKARSDLDIALPDGVEDGAYLAALEAALDRALAEARPRLVFYNAGVDVVADDRLGRLALSEAGLRARDRLVLTRLSAEGLPVCVVMGGGYGDAPTIAERHAVVFEEAARLA
ncbi:MAG: histone deacetylase [Pseudomonadota bacterium]